MLEQFAHPWKITPEIITLQLIASNEKFSVNQNASAMSYAENKICYNLITKFNSFCCVEHLVESVRFHPLPHVFTLRIAFPCAYVVLHSMLSLLLLLMLDFFYRKFVEKLKIQRAHDK